MRRWSPVTAVLVLLGALLAGCSDSGGGSGEDDFDDYDVKVDDKTGVILGVVVDASITPVVDATVRLEPGALEATTDREGRFAFDDLEPGPYFVEARKPGYIAAEQGVEVEAGVARPDIIKILLEPDPETVPFVATTKFDGFIECSFTLFLVSFAACSIAEDFNNDVFIDFVSFEPNAKWIQSEMVWDSTQALGDSMQLSYDDPSTGAQVRMNASAGTSPLLVTLNDSVIEEFELETGKEVWMRVFSTTREGTDLVEEETWNGPWRSTVYPAYNGTVPEDVQETFNSTAHQNVGGYATLNPIGEDCLKWAVLFDACMGVGGFGGVVQQEYTVYTHTFYNFKPDPEWRFTEHGDPETPE